LKAGIHRPIFTFLLYGVFISKEVLLSQLIMHCLCIHWDTCVFSRHLSWLTDHTQCLLSDIPDSLSYYLSVLTNDGRHYHCDW